MISSSCAPTAPPRRATSCRAGVADRVELDRGGRQETIEAIEGPFDLLFVDAAKDEYERYIELAEPKLSERAMLVVDNMLMSGEVALPEGSDTQWRDHRCDRGPSTWSSPASSMARLRAADRRRHRARGPRLIPAVAAG